MSLDDAVYTLLKDDATVAGLVGTRIYSMYVPEGEALPAIVFQQVSGIPNYSCDGAVGQRESRYQITAWGVTPVQARSLATAIDAVFSAYGGTVASITIQGSFVRSIYDVPDLHTSEFMDRFGKAVDIAIHTAD